MSAPVWKIMKGSSPVWQYCEQNCANKEVRCIKCKKVFAGSHGGASTSTVRYHMKSQHSLDVAKVTDSSVPKPKSSAPSEPEISSFFTPRDNSGSVAAHLCAVDRLSFNTVATSKQIHLGQKARGISLPQTAAGVQKAVLKFSNDTKMAVKAEISKKINSDQRFSLSVDEYTSTKNRRYMCLNLHGRESEVIGLGMIRVHGTLPAEKAVQLTQKKLDEFGLKIEKHIVGVVSDGASVMVKYARLLGVAHQICHAHGLHLAICDVLYKTIPEMDDNGKAKAELHKNLLFFDHMCIDTIKRE